MPTLQGAIKTIEFEDKATLQPRNNEFWDSVRLGKEALKRIKSMRPFGTMGTVAPLPGETKEADR